MNRPCLVHTTTPVSFFGGARCGYVTYFMHVMDVAIVLHKVIPQSVKEYSLAALHHIEDSLRQICITQKRGSGVCRV